MREISFYYSTKVWFATGVLAPVLAVLTDLIFSCHIIEHYVIGIGGFILFAILLGLAFSAPALVVFTFITWFFAERKMSDLQIKLFLIPIALLLADGTLYMISFYMDRATIFVMACYSVTLTVFMLLFSLRRE